MRRKMRKLAMHNEALVDRNWELKEAEERARSLFESQGDLIVMRDRDGRITFANDAYCRMAQRPCEDLIGSRFAFEVIFITSYQTRNIIEQAAAAYPANYIIKPIDEMQLFAGVQLVISRIAATNHTGKAFLQPNTLFSETELRILQLIREKKTTLEIAEALHLSRFTIKNHRHAICRKLDLRDENNALLKWVAENGSFFK